MVIMRIKSTMNLSRARQRGQTISKLSSRMCVRVREARGGTWEVLVVM